MKRKFLAQTVFIIVLTFVLALIWEFFLEPYLQPWDQKTSAEHWEIVREGTAFVLFASIALSLFGLRFISKRQLVEQEMIASEKAYMDLFEHAPDMYASVEAKTGKVVKCNETLAQKLGYQKSEILNQPVFNLYHHDYLPAAEKFFQIFCETGEIDSSEMALKRKDGGKIPVMLTVSAIRDENGRPAYSRSIWKDITDRKTIEESLLASNGLLRTIQKANLNFINNSDPKNLFDELLSGILDLTKSEYGFIGRVLSTSNGKPYLKSYTATDISWAAETQDLYNKYVDTGLEFFNKNTLFGAVITSHQPVISNDPASDSRAVGIPQGHPPLNAFLGLPFMKGKQIVGMCGIANRPGGYDNETIEYLEPFLTTCANFIHAFNEMERRKNVEQELKENNEIFHQLAHNTKDVFWIISSDGKEIVYVNQRYEEIWGQPCEKLYENPLSWIEAVHPEDRPNVLEHYNKMQLVKGEFEMTYRIVKPDGEVRWVWDRGFPIRDKNQKVIRVAGIATDITDFMESERQLKQYARELERSNKDLEEFAQIASHDLREPLRKVTLFGDRLRKSIADDEGTVYLNRMQKSAERMQRVIDDLLELSKINTHKSFIKPFDVGLVIKEVLDDLELQIKNTGAEISVGNMPTLEIDKNQIQKVLQNLISNSLKYSQEDITPVIHISSSKDSENGNWEITVQDNGIGFEEKYLPRIFKPFERLHGKSQYEGTGIGLSICEKIIKRHGGSITAKSLPQEGSQFIFTLPEKQPEISA